jgi:hypothetical protein
MCASAFKRLVLFMVAGGFCLFAGWLLLWAQEGAPLPGSTIPRGQSPDDATRKSAGCVSCHGKTDAFTMHTTNTFQLSCSDCHGGSFDVMKPAGAEQGTPQYQQAKEKAHPRPHTTDLFKKNSAANPVQAYAKWLEEDKEYIRFVNPGDLRVADETCGSCHSKQVRAVRTSMMTHGAMLWEAALYNNGGFPYKNAHFGESYTADGKPQTIKLSPKPDPELTRTKGVLPQLEPLGRWEVSLPGNLLRVFEKGGGMRPDLGSPSPEEEPGEPDDFLSDRGLGTLLRTDPVFLGLQKTRLLDPLLSEPGTNDHPGDYRHSGCTACHVIYANDRSTVQSGPYAAYGNQGYSSQIDPTIPKNESGHPIKHEFTRAIPTSQCIVCHIHPGTNMVATYLGFIWWDNETDGEHMYPPKQKDPTEEERYQSWLANPEAAAAKGLWGDTKHPEFLQQVGSPEFNDQLKHTQFADFHSHGWVFRAVYKRDRKGNLLDAKDNIVPDDSKDKFKEAVHLKDIHLEKGMHCVDCHFEQDSHGNGNLYGETRNAVEVDCIDCHGTITKKATLRTSAAAAPKGGTDLSLLRTPDGKRRFYWENGKLYQRRTMPAVVAKDNSPAAGVAAGIAAKATGPATVEDNTPWEVVQTIDSITPGNEHYSEASHLAKTLLKDGTTWGPAEKDETKLAHANSRMTCYTCHSSWTSSCFGCHLPMYANAKKPMLHNEGLTTRNYTSYNFEVLRDDIYMLGVDGTVTGHRIAPTRSTCAVVVSSQNANRDWLYYEQQTISSSGYSGFGFSPYYPHTTRATETKVCTDCHVSKEGNNNAWMAQLLMQGTNLVNFVGRYAYVAEGDHGFDAVTTAEHDDPPAVFGSDLQKIAYPANFAKFEKHENELDESDHHAGSTIMDLQARGEYLYAALGKGGFRAYDIANIDNKNFSEKMNTAPVSPWGQRFFVKTKYATAVGSPSTLAVDPLRQPIAENEETPPALFFGFLYVTDLEEGLVIIGNPDLKAKSPGVLTLLDGNPRNNFLVRAQLRNADGLLRPSFNPDGVLNGARRITLVGNFAYILCNKGLVVVDLANPTAPKVTAQIGAPDLVDPQGVAVQFRYGFVVDKEGLKILDTTNIAVPRVVSAAKLQIPELSDARNIYVARTYGYVSGGKQGMVILDLERPEHPRLEQVFNAGGKLSDTRDIKLGMTAASAFAYVADGTGGMKIVQLFAPNDNPNYLGFSPKPTPKLIASFKTKGPALAISKGLDRDRGVDESGNQVTVFNRRGSRPFNKKEMEAMYMHTGNGQLYTVTNKPPTPARQ